MGKYNKEFWLKYIFRLGHMSSVIILSGKIIMDFLYPCQGSQEPPKSQKAFFAVIGAILITSGFVNIFLLKTKKKLENKNKFWASALQFKFLSTIVVCTPLINFIAPRVLPDTNVNTIQFCFVAFWIVVSPFLRFYRELWTQVNIDKHKTQ